MVMPTTPQPLNQLINKINPVIDRELMINDFQVNDFLIKE